jgi:hypothetical protein
MSREQFLQADRRVRNYLLLILTLTSCAAIGLDLALPACAKGLAALRSQLGEGVGLLFAAAVLGPLLLIPLLVFLWVDRRFGLRCPGCKRSVLLRCRRWAVLRSGRCCLCQQVLFEPGDGAPTSPVGAAARPPT